jgi:hypothetical protein
MLQTGLRFSFSVNIFAACFAVLILNFTLVPAGMTQTAGVPEKVGVVYQVEGERFTEMTRTMGKKKTSLLITANTKLRMRFDGKSSDLVIDRSSSPRFAVVLPGGDTNKLLLYPLSVKKKYREAVIGTGGSIYGESSAGAETISLDFTKHSDDLYNITPAAPLTAGEYAFGFVGSNEFFCFSVQ